MADPDKTFNDLLRERIAADRDRKFRRVFGEPEEPQPDREDGAGK